ncbi:hypothetical protein [Salibacterium lacus]|uniref:Uncharacterized protein n=1 Tax=Salibacterium lacus TaxID=1898109 RepID=A0ABW5SX19_9BACI
MIDFNIEEVYKDDDIVKYRISWRFGDEWKEKWVTYSREDAEKGENGKEG